MVREDILKKKKIWHLGVVQTPSFKAEQEISTHWYCSWASRVYDKHLLNSHCDEYLVVLNLSASWLSPESLMKDHRRNFSPENADDFLF